MCFPVSKRKTRGEQGSHDHKPEIQSVHRYVCVRHLDRLYTQGQIMWGCMDSVCGGEEGVCEWVCTGKQRGAGALGAHIHRHEQPVTPSYWSCYWPSYWRDVQTGIYTQTFILTNRRGKRDRIVGAAHVSGEQVCRCSCVASCI